MNKILLLSSILISGWMSIAQENSPFARFPSLSPDGLSIAFSFQGDIWTADIDGNNANRITLHEAYESNPIWSADGKSIAFSSNRFGNDDIYTVKAIGGIPKRITYHSADDLLTDWTTNGQLIFQSNRSFRQVEWNREIQSVSSDGGTPQRVFDAFGSEAVQSPSGLYIAYVHGACRIAREAYTGSANRDIWIYNTQKKTYTQITNFDGQDYHPVWGHDNQLYFLSARSGKYNVFLATLSREGKVNGEIKQISSETKDGIRFFDVSADNSTLVLRKMFIYIE